MMSQAEITRMYLAGEDIAAAYRRRHMANLFIGCTLASPFVLVGLYLLKSALGINLIEGMHAWELFL